MKNAETANPLADFDQDVFRRTGVKWLTGVDEAGRGALAGPVVAGAVRLPPHELLAGLNDSKQLSPAKRENLFAHMRRHWQGAVGWATPEEIDRLNILQATHLAARRALSLLPAPEYLLTDYLKMEGYDCPVEPLVKGDGRSQVIAAASILAKVCRDRWMTALDGEFPEYGFAGHKGYGAKVHLEALEKWGPSVVHRLSFRGVCFFEVEPRFSRSFLAMQEISEEDQPLWEQAPLISEKEVALWQRGKPRQ